MMNELIKQLKQQPRHGQRQQINVAGQPVGTTAPQSQLVQSGVNETVQQLAQQLADQMVADMQQGERLARNGRVFTKFNTLNDVVKNNVEVVTAGLWSDNVASLTTFFTSSTQTNTQRTYYTDVFQSLPTADGAAVQFSVAYGNAVGSGSDSQGQLNDSPSKAIYSQYRQLFLNPTDNRFTTTNSGSTDSIYVINFKRNRVKESLDAGNFELPLSNIISRNTNATGSVTVGTSSITLIDDSSVAAATLNGGVKVYNLVSGSIDGGVYNPAAPHYYGLVYPQYGSIVLDGNVLDQRIAFKTGLGTSIEANNHFALFRSISGSATQINTTTGDLYGFMARNSETISSTHYFVRVKNAEYNFSNNPSYVTGSVGQIAQSTFVNDPKTYITTVGLYNDNQELLAVAKLSKPLLKSFQRESLIRVRLDF